MSGMHQRAEVDLAKTYATTDPILHAIDFEDVALTPVGARMVHLGAQAVLRQYIPAVELAKLTPSQAVAMFVDQVYWEENTGGLIMCAEMAHANLCLPIPSTHWAVRPTSGYSH
ncbi:hypothetical protein GM415_08595 [Pseudodesulfovibrio cashew]|uniref:Uncharacterized protein n=1 Tax=Pseudodesulfovibrio cashew TaxID=2678688 RepID=A0A6I6JRF8_9BACT|nr:hypothetical protein [Pseudodesulfovibrio cashew]QGY40184.1 hypothetical protein GM415_08595 [Pseudodesulfovibrio cashew]